MCPNTESFLVCIFLHLDWIRRDTPYLSVFSPNTGKYQPEKTPYLDTFHAMSYSYNFIKKRFWRRCFPVSTAKLLRTPIFQNVCEWMAAFVITQIHYSASSWAFQIKDYPVVTVTWFKIWLILYLNTFKFFQCRVLCFNSLSECLKQVNVIAFFVVLEVFVGYYLLWIN